MLDFLISFLLTIYSVITITSPDVATEKVIDTIQDNLPDITITVTPFPTLLKKLQENTSSDLKENSNSGEEKTEAFNTKSEKPVGLVAKIATQKSPALIPCSENPNLCITPTASPTPTPKPTETITPIPTIDPPKPHPPFCPQKNIYCLDVVCRLEANIADSCGCPCIPPNAH
jgi:hypothetical protein